MVLPLRTQMTLPGRTAISGNVIWALRGNTIHRVNITIEDRTSVKVDDATEPFVVISPADSGLQIGDLVVVSPLSIFGFRPPVTHDVCHPAYYPWF